jgi:hypothetical protein
MIRHPLLLITALAGLIGCGSAGSARPVPDAGGQAFATGGAGAGTGTTGSTPTGSTTTTGSSGTTGSGSSSSTGTSGLAGGAMPADCTPLRYDELQLSGGYDAPLDTTF